jgi:hypothetical protein
VPKLMIRKAADVPAPNRTAKAVREQQQLYEGFIRQATGNVGEVSLEAGDGIRSIKVKLRRAGTRVGVNLDIWDVDGKVYFQSEAPRPRRGRPRKTA